MDPVVDIDVGTPTPRSRQVKNPWSIRNIRYHQFESLSGRIEASFSCMGYHWQLYLWPHGYHTDPSTYDSDEELEDEAGEGMVSIYIRQNGTSSSNVISWNNIDIGFSVKDSDGREVVNTVSKYDYNKLAIGEDNFALRKTLLDALIDGTLYIEVRLRKSQPIMNTKQQFVPDNPLNKNILQKFMHEESADIIFEVDNDSKTEKTSSKKRSKTSTTFFAHRFILNDISTTFAELCKQSKEENITTVSVTDVKPGIFKHMLYHSYGGELSGDDLNNNAKLIIDAADRYGIISLKLKAEVHYVESTKINIDNMMDNLLYADSKNLALLNEAVMDYIVENELFVAKNESFDNVPSHLMKDLLIAMARKKETSNFLSIMRISDLRKKLNDKGLGVDGSREAMISALREDYKKQAEVANIMISLL